MRSFIIIVLTAIFAQTSFAADSVDSMRIVECDPAQGAPVGSKPGKLSLPGHPRNGELVCAIPGDPNITEWTDGGPVVKKEPGVCYHQCKEGLTPVFAPNGAPACFPSGKINLVPAAQQCKGPSK